MDCLSPTCSAPYGRSFRQRESQIRQSRTAFSARKPPGPCSAGLNPSGKADLTTWNAVFARAARLRKERAPALGASFFPPGAVIAPGSTGDAVLAVQIMLGTLSDNFINFDAVERTGIYDEKTAGQIRRFQGCAALPESGVTDKPTWNALCRCYAVWRSGGSRIIGETERVPPFGRPTA